MNNLKNIYNNYLHDTKFVRLNTSIKQYRLLLNLIKVYLCFSKYYKYKRENQN